MKKSSQTGWHRNAYAAALLAFGLTFGFAPRAAHAACVGDCDGDGEVTVNELISMVNIALGTAAPSTCANGDQDGSGEITVNEIISGVNNALGQTPCIPVATGTPTVTPTGRVCGNGVTEAPEQCDDGGVCAGGDNAGTACTSEGQCTGKGVCVSGSMAQHPCSTNADCPASACVRCKPTGGDGCASNCTNEHDVPVNLVGGVVEGLDIKAGTTGAVVHGDVLTIPLPIGPSCKGGSKKDKACTTDGDCPGGTCLLARQVLTVGGDAGNGIIPFVIKATNVQLPRIPVSTLACACVRAVPAKTCGGTIFNDAGGLEPDCSDGFGGAGACAGKKACAFVHGPGNSTSGALGCGAAGLTGVDLSFQQSCGGSTGTPGAPMLTLSGSGPTGSAILLNTTAIGTIVGSCSGTDPDNYGRDGEFCTEDDPATTRGIVATLPQVTGTATGHVTEANGDDGLEVGPFSVTGHPFDCAAVATGSSGGGIIVGAFTTCGQATVGDIVVTNVFVAP